MLHLLNYWGALRLLYPQRNEADPKRNKAKSLRWSKKCQYVTVHDYE